MRPQGPEKRHLAKCRWCKAPIAWARTVASESGAGGKPMPLDFAPDPAGNVAARIGNGHRILARVLRKDETHDQRAEWLAMPHAATCGKNFADQVEAYLADVAAQEGAPQ